MQCSLLVLVELSPIGDFHSIIFAVAYWLDLMQRDELKRDQCSSPSREYARGLRNLARRPVLSTKSQAAVIFGLIERAANLTAGDETFNSRLLDEHNRLRGRERHDAALPRQARMSSRPDFSDVACRVNRPDRLSRSLEPPFLRIDDSLRNQDSDRPSDRSRSSCLHGPVHVVGGAARFSASEAA